VSVLSLSYTKKVTLR